MSPNKTPVDVLWEARQQILDDAALRVKEIDEAIQNLQHGKPFGKAHKVTPVRPDQYGGMKPMVALQA
jgi:hypothetical protein